MMQLSELRGKQTHVCLTYRLYDCLHANYEMMSVASHLHGLFRGCVHCTVHKYTEKSWEDYISASQQHSFLLSEHGPQEFPAAV